MCGIAGFSSRDGHKAYGPLIKGLLKRLAHRGPDDKGWLCLRGSQVSHGREVPEDLAGEAFLCHRRLSIIDVSAAGAQPMRSPDGRYAIAFNGEIYNYVELRAELEQLGETFQSHSDTEVLLHAYIRWGEQCLPRLTGMFAFSVLDCQTRRLFLARDPFGIKPLYYANWSGGFAFASEIKPLLDFPGIKSQADAGRVYDFLVTGLTDSGSRTMFAGIQQLLPGSWFELGIDGRGAARFGKYWTPHPGPVADISFAEATDRLRELFLKNVRLHLRSDVPVGAALSGGVDSSAIVAAMRQVQGPALQIHTFTYGDRSPVLNEEKWAGLVSRSAGTKAHQIHLTPGNLLGDLPALIRAQEQPFGGTSIYAQYSVFRAAHEQGIKVMLDGQGADEIFAGYHKYFAPRLVSLLRQWRCGGAFAFARAALRFPGLKSRDLFRRAAGFLLPDLARGKMLRLAGRYQPPQWLNEAWFQERDAIPPAVRRFGQRGSRVLTECLATSLADDSLPFLLRYEDRNSMAFSIESRVPFLTTELVDFVYALPEEYLIDPAGNTKSILRAALRGIGPDPVLDRRDKIGFATSEFDWLKEQRAWATSVFADPDWSRRVPVFNYPGVARELEQVFSGELPFDFRIWRMINLRLWAEEFGVNFA